MKRIVLILLIFSLLCAVSCNNTELTDTSETVETSDTTASVETTETTIETTTETTEQTTLQSTETTYVEALGEYKVKLSTMSEEDCRRFLEEAGVEIPEILQGTNVKGAITKYEKDPEAFSGYSWTVAAAFMEDIQSAVRHYYGLPYLWEIWDWHVPLGTTSK